MHVKTKYVLNLPPIDETPAVQKTFILCSSIVDIFVKRHNSNIKDEAEDFQEDNKAIQVS